MKEIEFTGSDGIRLVADLGGPPAAPLVLLAHGGGQTRHSWGTTAATLAAKGYRVLSLDQRGHGNSDWDKSGNYFLHNFTADICAAVDKVSTRQSLVLVGASLGGLASLMAAASLSAAGLAGLVLVDVVPRVTAHGSSRIKSFMARHLDGFASLEEAADAIAAYRPERPRPDDVTGLNKNLRRGADGRYYWHWDPALVGVGRLAHADPVGFSVAELEHAASNVAVPTLLVRGMLSDVVSDEGERDLKQLIPHLETVNVRDAGHMVVGDDNAIFGVVIEGFLARILADASCHPPIETPPAMCRKLCAPIQAKGSDCGF